MKAIYCSKHLLRILIPTLLVGTPLGAQANDGKDILVYASNLNIETYVPMTPANIVCRAQEKWMLSRNGKGRQLLKLFSKSNGNHFTEKRTRVEIVDGNTNYFIDAEGFAVKDRENLKINIHAFQKLASSLSTNERQANDHRGSCTHHYIKVESKDGN